MSEINPPPLPGKKAMIAMAFSLVALVGLVILILVIFATEQTPQEKEQALLAKQEQQDNGKDNTSALNRYKTEDGTASEQQKEFERQQEKALDNIQDEVGDDKYGRQLQRRTEGAMDEGLYLKMRQWNFWYIMVPALILIVVFLIWVYKTHKKWIK